MFNLLIKKYIGSFVRSLLQAVAGYLVTIGALGADVVTPWVTSTADIIIAVLMYLISLGWSLAEKKAKVIQ